MRGKAVLLGAVIYGAYMSNMALASQLLVPSTNQEAWITAKPLISLNRTPIDEIDLDAPEIPILSDGIAAIDFDEMFVEEQPEITEEITKAENISKELLSLLDTGPSGVPSLEREELANALDKLPKDYRDMAEGFIDNALFFVAEFTAAQELDVAQRKIAEDIAASLNEKHQAIIVIVPDAQETEYAAQISAWISYLRDITAPMKVLVRPAEAAQKPILQDRRIFAIIQ